jgi:small subunit ribosomal protein S19
MKRSRWKGVYVKPEQSKKPNTFSRVPRSSTIIPKFSGQTFKVHNGKSFREITITKEMLGYKFGEFSKTRSDFAFKKKKKKKK